MVLDLKTLKLHFLKISKTNFNIITKQYFQQLNYKITKI